VASVRLHTPPLVDGHGYLRPRQEAKAGAAVAVVSYQLLSAVKNDAVKKIAIGIGMRKVKVKMVAKSMVKPKAMACVPT